MGGSNSQMFIMLPLIIIVFYFFMIRPQVKKQKDQKKFADDLKKGDRVITTSGAHGRITEINDTTIVIEGESGHKTRYEKSAVSLEATKALNAPAKA
jgi:preprotein translocase subunit YajC